MKDVLAFVGIMTIIMLIMFSMVLICEALIEIYNNVVHNYNIKHRFDKPPKAECYCVDCVNFNPYAGRCEYYNHYTVDGDFCSKAKPRKSDI